MNISPKIIIINDFSTVPLANFGESRELFSQKNNNGILFHMAYSKRPKCRDSSTELCCALC